MDGKCKLYDLEKIKEEHGCKLCRYHHGDAECRYHFYQQVVIPAMSRNDVLCPGFERKGEINERNKR